LVKILNLAEYTLAEEIKFNDDFKQCACTLVKNIFLKEIKSKDEHLFIITLRRRIVKGAYIINIGSLKKCVINYKSLAKYALEDDADEVFVFHNHPVILDEEISKCIYASEGDLIAFYNIFRLFSLLDIEAVCGIFACTDEALHATFYLNDNRLPSYVIKKAGWKFRKSITTTNKNDNRKKEKNNLCPYVEINTKEELFFLHSVVHNEG
jgi:hypothetical protein